MSDEVKRYTLYPQLKPEALAFLPDVVIDARDFDALLTENLEQARLLGMSAERELALLAERDAYKKALEKLARVPGCGCSFPCRCGGEEWTRAELEGRMDYAAETLTRTALQGEQP